MDNLNNHKKSKKIIRRFLVFLIFEFVFTVITMPIIVFYGPFQNVKRIIVGSAVNSFRHKYIVNLFLNDRDIEKILSTDTNYDKQSQNSDITALDFKNKHSSKIDVYDLEGRTFKGKMMVVYDPSRVVVGYSSKFPISGETTSAIAKRNGAIAAINAGGFRDVQRTGTGGAPMGFIFSRGNLVYNQVDNEKDKQDTVAITKDGMLIVGPHSIAQLKKHNVKEGVSFGPPLIVKGKPVIRSGDGGWGIAPRTAIGQRKDGAILLMTVDGRSVNSLGATLKDIQDIFIQYNAENAVNLDGGSSTTMFFNGKIINTPSDALGERAVPSTFMVMPSKGGE